MGHGAFIESGEKYKALVIKKNPARNPQVRQDNNERECKDKD
jgi:hypothetical protein